MKAVMHALLHLCYGSRAIGTFASRPSAVGCRGYSLASLDYVLDLEELYRRERGAAARQD